MLGMHPVATLRRRCRSLCVDHRLTVRWASSSAETITFWNWSVPITITSNPSQTLAPKCAIRTAYMGSRIGQVPWKMRGFRGPEFAANDSAHPTRYDPAALRLSRLASVSERGSENRLKVALGVADFLSTKNVVPVCGNILCRRLRSPPLPANGRGQWECMSVAVPAAISLGG